MNILTTQLELIGLTESDIDEKIESTEELIHYVSSSSRLFRKTIKHILLKDIRIYFNQNTIGLHSELKSFFPRKGRRAEWIKFSNFFYLRVPGLKLTKFSIGILIIYAVTIIYLLLWLLFGQFELVVHSIISKVSLIPIVLVSAFFPFGMIHYFGETALPSTTFEELTDKIISKNLSDLLTDDRRIYKEIINNELTVGAASA